MYNWWSIICFHGNEKFSHGHKCKVREQRELRMFVVKSDDEEWEILEDLGDTKKELNMVEVVEDDQTVIELSINSVVGLSNPGTMKVKGKIKEREVVILIDCRATHNFISTNVVEELQLTTKDTSHYGVILGSDTTVKGKGACEAVEGEIEQMEDSGQFLTVGARRSRGRIGDAMVILVRHH